MLCNLSGGNDNIPCACTHVGCYATCPGWGDDKVLLHIERNITSVVHSHPSSHYIRTHALGWQLVMFTLPAARKTNLNAFASMLPHCTAHMRRTISLFLSRPWTAVVFGMALPCFSVCRASPHPSLQQAVCGMPLTSQIFGVTCVLKFRFDTRATRGFVRNWGSNDPTSPVQCSFVKIWLSSDLVTNENVQWQWLPRGFLPARRVFLGKMLGVREQLASSHANHKHLNARRIAWENTRKENPRNAAGFLRGAYALEKDKEFAFFWTFAALIVTIVADFVNAQ